MRPGDDDIWMRKWKSPTGDWIIIIAGWTKNKNNQKILSPLLVVRFDYHTRCVFCPSMNLTWRHFHLRWFRLLTHTYCYKRQRERIFCITTGNSSCSRFKNTVSRSLCAGRSAKKKKRKTRNRRFPISREIRIFPLWRHRFEWEIDEYPPQPFFLPRKLTCRLFVVESQIFIGITSPIAFCF